MESRVGIQGEAAKMICSMARLGVRAYGGRRSERHATLELLWITERPEAVSPLRSATALQI
jgi:hypothetical protein